MNYHAVETTLDFLAGAYLPWEDQKDENLGPHTAWGSLKEVYPFLGSDATEWKLHKGPSLQLLVFLISVEYVVISKTFNWG